MVTLDRVELVDHRDLRALDHGELGRQANGERALAPGLVRVGPVLVALAPDPVLVVLVDPVLVLAVPVLVRAVPVLMVSVLGNVLVVRASVAPVVPGISVERAALAKGLAGLVDPDLVAVVRR
jgi:hypothetical protein